MSGQRVLAGVCRPAQSGRRPGLQWQVCDQWDRRGQCEAGNADSHGCKSFLGPIKESSVTNSQSMCEFSNFLVHNSPIKIKSEQFKSHLGQKVNPSFFLTLFDSLPPWPLSPQVQTSMVFVWIYDVNKGFEFAFCALIRWMFLPGGDCWQLKSSSSLYKWPMGNLSGCTDWLAGAPRVWRSFLPCAFSIWSSNASQKGSNSPFRAFCSNE